MEMICPRCGSNKTVKNGQANGRDPLQGYIQDSSSFLLRRVAAL